MRKRLLINKKRLSGGGKARVLTILFRTLSFLPWGRAPVGKHRWALSRKEGESGTHSSGLSQFHTSGLSLNLAFCPASSSALSTHLFLEACLLQDTCPAHPSEAAVEEWKRAQIRSQGLTLPLTKCMTSNNSLSLPGLSFFIHKISLPILLCCQKSEWDRRVVSFWVPHYVSA